MATSQTPVAGGNLTGGLGLVLAAATAWGFYRFHLCDGVQSFNTPLGDFSLSGGLAQMLATVGAFITPQLLVCLAGIPVVAQIVSFFTQPAATSAQLCSLTTTVNGIDQRTQAIAAALNVPASVASTTTAGTKQPLPASVASTATAGTKQPVSP